ncbi:BTB/POZ domain-containing protein 6, partial [Aphelenchoides avenae]
MKSLLANQQTHDVKFVVKDLKIGAHAIILAEASDTFKSMFYGDPTRPDVIPVEGGTPEGFRLLLSYIYTDETQLTADNVEAVLHFAKKYHVVGLIERAGKFLDVHVTPANIIDKNGETVLKSSAFLSHSEALLSKIISRDTLNASEVVVFDRAVAWAKAKLEREKQPTDYPGNIRIKLGSRYTRFASRSWMP